MPATTISPYFKKDPLTSADLLGVTWESWLADKPGVSLASCTVTVSPAGLTATSPATVSGAVATTSMSGGTLGTSYEVAFQAVFSDGQDDVQRLIVAVEKIPTGLA